MMKNSPTWVKVLAVISILIILFLMVITIESFVGVNSGKYDSMGLIIIPLFILPIFFGILALWGLGYLFRYLIRREKYWIANTISIICLFGLLIPFILFIVSLFTFIDAQIITIEILLLIPIIYFGIALKLISKSRKGVKVRG